MRNVRRPPRPAGRRWGEYLSRAAAIRITWPVLDGIDDAELERRLFTPPSIEPPLRPMPDWPYDTARHLGDGGSNQFLQSGMVFLITYS
jgi:hypothetical protein